MAIVVEGSAENSEARSVFVFRSRDFDEAFARSIELGRGLEQQYKNGDGQVVNWMLLEIETLDLLGDEIFDGREVYSEPISCPRGRVKRQSDINPEKSNPTSSGV